VGWGTSHFADAGGLRLHYRHLGEAGRPAVVLLHGFPQDSWMWRHQGPALAERYEIYAPDTRGFGLSEKPRIRVTRDILARDIVGFLDAVGLDQAFLVGHDWGGIIAFKAAIEYPQRFPRLALIDTLTTVWIPWGIHGYWFKCAPLAEHFFRDHGVEFVRSVFGGEGRRYGGPPETPWVPAAGGEAMHDWDPSRFFTKDDVDHYAEVFDDPDVWFHAVQYYRHGLPFHAEDSDGRFEFWSTRQVEAMWHHPLATHPDRDRFPVFAPEDRHKTYPYPALYLYSAFLVPQAFARGFPADNHIIGGNPYADSFPRHLSDLRCRAAATGHFIPEEDPVRTNAVLLSFLAGDI
jgi:pimeloyl-ACP methyl ester carboxylesterase